MASALGLDPAYEIGFVWWIADCGVGQAVVVLPHPLTSGRDCQSFGSGGALFINPVLVSHNTQVIGSCIVAFGFVSLRRDDDRGTVP